MTQQTQQQQQPQQSQQKESRERRKARKTCSITSVKGEELNGEEQECMRQIRHDLSSMRLGRRYHMDNSIKQDIETQGLAAFRLALAEAPKIDERRGAQALTAVLTAVKKLVEEKCVRTPYSRRHGQASTSRSADSAYEKERKAKIAQNNEKLIELGLMPPS